MYAGVSFPLCDSARHGTHDRGPALLIAQHSWSVALQLHSTSHLPSSLSLVHGSRTCLHAVRLC